MHTCSKWHCPPLGFVKCNVDATVCSSTQVVGLGLVLRDDTGSFLACQMVLYASSLMTKEAEVLGPLTALSWACFMNYSKVVFEMDVKTVVDAIKYYKEDATEFGSLIAGSITFFHLEQTFSISFVKRQANEVAHTLAKETCFHACPMFFSEILSCIYAYLSLMCSDSHH
ncbi:hypothetical protein PTKIN_Ptkin11bG0058900 [Pterospermum kingtungense]